MLSLTSRIGGWQYHQIITSSTNCKCPLLAVFIQENTCQYSFGERQLGFVSCFRWLCFLARDPNPFLENHVAFLDTFSRFARCPSLILLLSYSSSGSPSDAHIHALQMTRMGRAKKLSGSIIIFLNTWIWGRFSYYGCLSNCVELDLSLCISRDLI